MTVLRAPTIPTCLHEPISYTMKDYDGIRDDGHHSFEFALCGYGTDFAGSTVCRDAETFSRLPVEMSEKMDVEMPVVLSGNAMISHIKCAEDGSGIILRVTECAGKPTVAAISMPNWVKEVHKTNMAETTSAPADLGALQLKPYEIMTIKLRY